MVKRTNPKHWVRDHKQLFEPYFERPLMLRVDGQDENGGTYSADLGPIYLKDLQPTRLTDVENAPPKRMVEGKSVTPPCFTLTAQYEDGRALTFTCVCDDAHVIVRMAGFVLLIGDIRLEFTERPSCES